MYSIDDPYNKWYVIYPAFITAVYKLLGNWCMPFVEITGTRDIAFDFRDNQILMFIFIISFIISIYAIRIFCHKIGKGVISDRYIDVLFLFLICSGPLIYAIMRGNSIIWDLTLIMIFVIGYKSENKIIKYISYLALACSIGIKITSVFLALLLIKNKEWKGFVLCTLLSAIIFFIPFLYTGGCLLDLLNNISNHMDTTKGIGSPVTVSDWTHMLNGVLSENIISILEYSALGIIFIFSFIAIIFNKKITDWEQMAILCGLMVVGLGIGIRYYFIFMIIPLIYFLTYEKEITVKNLLIMVSFILMFTTFIIPAIGSICIFLIMSIIFYESMSKIANNKKSAIHLVFKGTK